MDASLFKGKRKQLTDAMEPNSILVLFADSAPHKSADAHYTFTPNRNFYYITGIAREHSVYIAVNTNGLVTEQLFIEKADPDVEKWVGRKLKKADATTLSGIETVGFVDELEALLARKLSSGLYQTMYLDLSAESWAPHTDQAHRFARDIAQRHPYLGIRNVHATLSSLRMTKSDDEVENIRKAIEITNLGIRNLLVHAKPEMFEYELEAHFNFTLKSHGVREHAFTSIVASGENGVILHYEENDRKVENGDLVLLDLGASYRWYNADISRTFPVNGKFSDRQKELYNIVLLAMQETMDAVKPGLPIKRLNEITKEVLGRELRRIGLIQNDAELSKYYYHGVSHYLGLDTHDVGFYEDVTLVPGMVLTIEPGLYIAEEATGIRIEDNVLVTSDGYENLSSQIPKTVEEIEAIMASR